MLLFVSVCFCLFAMGLAQPTPLTLYSTFIFYVKNGIQPNSRITMYVAIPLNLERFIVDFHEVNNIFFHFRPFRYSQSTTYTVLNRIINGTWGSEEVKSNHFPFAVGKNYKLDFEVTEEKYTVYVNDKYYLEYKNQVKPWPKFKFISTYGVDVAADNATFANLKAGTKNVESQRNMNCDD